MRQKVGMQVTYHLINGDPIYIDHKEPEDIGDPDTPEDSCLVIYYYNKVIAIGRHYYNSDYNSSEYGCRSNTGYPTITFQLD